MPLHHPHPLIRRLQPLVWLVLLLTGLGLSRSAVLCTQPCCAGHVKLVARCSATETASATSTDSCCRPAARRGLAPTDGDERDPAPDPAPHTEDSSDCGCHHVRLGVELAPPPTLAPRLTGELACGPDRVEPSVAMPIAASPTTGHPPATGPPPHALRSAHRAMIQLLL